MYFRDTWKNIFRGNTSSITLPFLNKDHTMVILPFAWTMDTYIYITLTYIHFVWSAWAGRPRTLIWRRVDGFMWGGLPVSNLYRQGSYVSWDQLWSWQENIHCLEVWTETATAANSIHSLSSSAGSNTWPDLQSQHWCNTVVTLL